MKTTSVGPRREFTFIAPNAQSVFLTGSFTQWQEHPIPMKKNRTGVWKTSLHLQPGTYHYRFLVDGEWQDDPNCSLHVPNPFGSVDDVCIVA